VSKQVKQVDRVIIRFAGDSGDGMQLTGDRFTQESAAFGNDLVTLPNFPAEIRAPQGTLPGVSSFQVHFADHDILTSGDAPDVLVAMNPAALKANLPDLPRGAAIIVDSHDFSDRNLTKAGYGSNPLASLGDANDQLGDFQVFPLDLTGMTVEAVKEFGLSRKDAARAKNMFALGLLSWMYGRPTETTIDFLGKRFARVADIRDAIAREDLSVWVVTGDGDALDRRQPPDPRAAPQREHDDPVVQQPDLRADQGPVLPTSETGKITKSTRWARSTTPATRSRWRWAPRAASWPAPSTPTASTSPRCSPRPPRTAAPHRWRSTGVFNRSRLKQRSLHGLNSGPLLDIGETHAGHQSAR
jgi:Pyruvate/2-oxoacid:ferredoxin oxidoreductase gamma subunit